MRTPALRLATPPLPGQLSETAFPAFILPPRAMPKRGPTGTLGSPRVWHFIVWVLSPGMPWQGFPMPPDPTGKPGLHATTISTVCAHWADNGSLGQALGARVRPLAPEQPRDLRVLPGDGTHPGATTGAMVLAPQATSTRTGRRASP